MRKARIWRAFLIKERKIFENKNAWLRREDSNLDMEIRRSVREKRQNLFPLKFISNSKRSNFENRTEWMKFRDSERNGLSENNMPARPIGSAELK